MWRYLVRESTNPGLRWLVTLAFYRLFGLLPPPPPLGSAVLGVTRHFFSCVGATLVRYTYKLFGLGADFFILWLSSVASKFWCENQFS